MSTKLIVPEKTTLVEDSSIEDTSVKEISAEKTDSEKDSVKKDDSEEDEKNEQCRSHSHSGSFVRSQGLPEMAEHLRERERHLHVSLSSKGSWCVSD